MNTENNNAAANPQSHKAAQSTGTAISVAGTIARLQHASQSTHAYFLQGHLKVYAHIAEIAAFFVEVTSDKVKYTEFLVERACLGVPAAPKAGNKYLPFVRVLDGTWRDANGNVVAPGTTKAVWRPNRSSEKFATVLDYLFKKGIKPDAMAKYIEEFKDKDGRKKIHGIITEVQAQRGVTRTPTALTWKTGERENIRKAATLCELPLKPADIKTHDGLAPALVCEENGKMVLKAVPLGTAEDFIRYVRSLGITEAAATEGSKGYTTGNGVSVDLEASREAAEANA